MTATSRDEHSRATVGAEDKGGPQIRARPPVSQIELGPDRIRAALQRMLDSSDFIASDRNRRFLHYVVEETLAGRGDRLKGYTIAVEVFGRDATFNPNADPIVRVEARRLRDALERYHLTSGRADPVRISIPKGGYVPVFEPLVSADTQSQPAAQPASEPPRAKTPARRANWLLVALLATGLALIVLVARAYSLS